MSFSRLPEDPTPAAVFGEYLPMVQLLFTEAQIIKRLSNEELVGNLVHLERDSAYWVYVKLPQGVSWIAIPLPGEATDPDLKYTLHSGVNMISFAGPAPAPLPAAMTLDDLAIYESWIGEGMGLFLKDGKWLGNLTSLKANDGYEVIVNQAKDVTLSCPDCDGVTTYSYGCKDSHATNFDAAADIDDNSCTYDVPGNWPMPFFASNGKNQAFVLVHKLGNKNAVASFSEGQGRGFGYAHGEFTVVPVIDAPFGAPITLKQYNAADQTEAEIKLTTPLDMQLNAFVVVGCTEPTAANYSDLATHSADICQ